MAHAQSRGATRRGATAFDPYLAAQSAYLHRDYDEALRLSNETLKRDPRKTEARRLGAKAARALRQFYECLRLTAGIEPVFATVDDVQLVGECSVEYQVTPSVVQYMQKNLELPDKRSMANYWLGVFSYQQGDHTKAQPYLRAAQALPSKLERERVSMLARIQLLLGQQKQPSPAPLPQPPPPAPPTPVPVVVSPAPAPGSVPAPTAAVEPPENRAVWMNRALLTKDGQILNWDFSFRSGLFQRYFSEGALERGVQPTPGTSTLFQASARAEGRWGFARKNLFGLGIFANASVQNGDDTTLPYFSGWDLTWPQLPAEVWVKGAAFTPGIFLGLAINPQLNLLVKAFYQGGLGGFRSAEAASGVWGAALLNWDKVFLKAGAQMLINVKSVGGAQLGATEYFFDVQTTKLGRVAFVPLPGHPLLRYFVTYPKDSTISSARFMQIEGSFFEFNLTPRLYISDALSISGLFRYVLGSNRSYVSEALAKAIQNNPQDFLPSANYQSTQQQIQARACYDLKGGQLAGGISFLEIHNRLTPQDLPKEETWADTINSSILKGRTVFVEALFEL